MDNLDIHDSVLMRLGPYVKAGREMTHITWAKHPESKNRVMTEIVCKLCRGVIAGQVESDAKVPSRVIHGATYLYKTLTFSRFHSYAEVTLLFDDGSKHVTHVCTGCKSKLDSPDVLEYIYACDLAQWLYEEQHGHGDALWNTYPDCATRVPIAWKDNGGLT